MLLNKKGVYIGATLFSAVILTSLSEQTVKADATTSSTSTSTAALSNSTTATTTQSGSDPVATALVSSPTATTSTGTSTASTPSSVTTTAAPTSVASTSTDSTTSTGTSTVSTSSSGAAPTSSTGTASVSPTTSTTGTSTVSTPSSGTTPTSSTSTAPTSSTSTVSSSTTATSAPASGTSTVAPSSQTTTSTAATSGTSSTGISSQGSSIPITTPTGTPTTTTPSTTTTTTTSYAIPSDITDSTVVPITDPTLATLVKVGLGLKPTDPITVGDIKGYTKAVTLGVNELSYALSTPSLSSLTEPEYPAVESLAGIQYLKLLPSDMISLTVRLASDANANPDLTPLDGIKLNGLELIGNFSNPAAKEIDVNQITKLDVPTYGDVTFFGDSNYNGINNQELKTLAPWIIAYSNNGQKDNALSLNGNDVTDYSPLKDIDRNDVFEINDNGGAYDPTPIYAVTGQPIKFTSQPVLGLDGEDLASGYHFTSTVPAGKAADDDLINLGNDQYEIENPDTTAKVLTYGDVGFTPQYNPTYSMDALTYKTYGTDPFINILIHAQPLIWQAHPNVTIAYEDSTGKPILSKGVPLTKTVDGVNIGDSFDLTADSKLAGYTLKSAPSTLKGAYTQNPQIVTLEYTKNPVVDSGSSSTSSSSTSTKPTTTKPVEPKSSEPVKLFDIQGDPTGEDSILVDMGVKATATIDGKLYYQVGYGQLVLASYFNSTRSVPAGIVRTFGSETKLVDSNGKTLSYQLAPNTGWKYDKIVTINGADYYQVATDEFLSVASSVPFTPVTAPTNVNITQKSPIYNSQGQSLKTTLPKGTSWATDGCAIINGVKMYRVATDEWIPATGISAYEPVTTTYSTSKSTTLYDIDGKPVDRYLPANTSWKVDQIIMIDGQKYYRVATNEYVLA